MVRLKNEQDDGSSRLPDMVGTGYHDILIYRTTGVLPSQIRIAAHLLCSDSIAADSYVVKLVPWSWGKRLK